MTGIDASPEMLARLHQHTVELPVEACIADMADFRLPAAGYAVVYVVASTFLLLTTADRQASCVASAAASLEQDGFFVVEAALPATVLAGHRDIVVRHVAEDHLRLTVQTHDPLAQLVRSQEIRLQSDGHWRMLPSAKRYVSPAELDLMAQTRRLTTARPLRQLGTQPLHRCQHQAHLGVRADGVDHSPGFSRRRRCVTDRMAWIQSPAEPMRTFSAA